MRRRTILRGIHDQRQRGSRGCRPGARGRRLLAAGAFCVLALALTAAPAGASVPSAVDSILAKRGVAAYTVGVCIRDLDTGQVVYARDSLTPLAPASNLKLVTSAAALRRWGTEFRFMTELYGPAAPVKSGVLKGNVFLKGYGDPSLSTLEYQRHVLHLSTSSFESLAKRLRALGVRKVKGRVLGDESWFDRQRFGSSWNSSLRLESGLLSALTGNESLDNGNRVQNPALFAARLYTHALRKAGIKVSGTPGTGKVPSTATLFRHEYSAPLPAVIRHMNQESDNFFAEIITKGLGKDVYDKGSTSAGAEVLTTTLEASDISSAQYTIVDGSGLSYSNRLTADAVVTLLGDMWLRSDFRPYYTSLAVAGESGTLDDRMRGTAAAGNAHAKTGTLNIAICLSGYVKSANKHRVAFSILMNGGSVSWSTATAAQDAIVVALAKARLPGSRQSPFMVSLHHFPLSASESVHATGGRF